MWAYLSDRTYVLCMSYVYRIPPNPIIYKVYYSVILEKYEFNVQKNMRNALKGLFIVVSCLMASNLWGQNTTIKKYTFDDGVALATDWTVEKTVPTGGEAICEITQSLSGASFSKKDGNYLGLAYKNKSNVGIDLTSKAEFKNISSFSMEVVSGDNSKPTFAVYIVDKTGATLETVIAPIGSKEGFATGGTNKWGSKTVQVANKTGYIKIVTTASSSGKYAAIDNIAVTYQAGPSTDATLSALTYGGTSVPNFSAEKLDYEVELPADYIGVPSVVATATDGAANVNITQATNIPGKATIVVTAEDGTTTKTYTVTFTRESANPKVLTATWDNIRGTANIDQVNSTITGQVLNGNSLTLTPTFTGKYIDHWAPQGAQNFANGPINYTFTSATNETTVYAVTITEAAAMSTDATLKSLTYNGTSVPNFSPTTYVYNIELASNATVPTVAAVANDIKATAVVTQASGLPGVAKVLVTAEDNTVTQTYTVNFTVAVPSTDLTLHVPEKYEAKASAEGYNTPLTAVGEREYEVYYTERAVAAEYPTFSTTPVAETKTNGISASTSETENVGRQGDTWFYGTILSTSECKKASSKDEFVFAEKTIREHRLGKDNVYKFHVKGYDQFSLWGMDKKVSTEVFVVKIDGRTQPTDASLYNSNNYTIRRYNMTTGEHLIEISASTVDDRYCYMGGFSLRIPQEPKTKRLKGNDSTQVVLQTMAVRPVTYVTKYNNIPGAETKLEWKGTPATGVELKKREGSLADTLVLSGTVACPVGIYNYALVSYLNGVETSRAEGKFTVKSDIMTLSASADAKVYTNEEMDPIEFQYYALNASDVKLTWENNQAPAGIAGKGTTAGKYEISGTTKTKGTYNYSITVTDADTTIKGTITVEELDYGNNPVLYLFKNDNAPDKDGVYKYLTSQGKNLIKRKAKEEGLRPADQYQKYNWVLISEDVDADNKEVLALARGQGGLPVLNMKSFTYTEGRLNWGEPDNGSLSQNGCYITVQRDDHPIFKALNKKRGDQIMVLDTVIRKGLMPINVNYSGTLCLATALTRDKEDYYGDGPEQTILHEVPASMNLGQKYICLPIGAEGSNRLTNDGKKLIDQCIKYILSNEATTITVPQIAITKFKIGSYEANNIDDGNHLIEINVEVQDSDAMKAATPEITLASPLTFYTADKQYVNADGTVDFSNWHYGVRYVVSDYINSWYYDVVINLYDPHEGIENIEVGTWVNIYDIYGRKVATTNEDLRTMALPQGMYIVVTEDGQTIKIMK